MRAALERGLIINAPNDETIRIVPPLNITSADVAEFADKFAAALATVSGSPSGAEGRVEGTAE